MPGPCRRWDPRSVSLGTGNWHTAVIAGLIGGGICLVPWIYLALSISQAYFLLVDRNLGAIDALRASFLVMRGNRVRYFLLLLLFALLQLAGLVACLIGEIGILPYCTLSTAVAYLAMTNEAPG